jgi:ribosome assembly protein 1
MKIKQKYFNQRTNLTTKVIDQALKAGFDLATLRGPLCEEPMFGVCFIVEDFYISEDYLE